MRLTAEMDLILVESPTKAKTIERFLKGAYIVRSSYGHVRDLPEKKLGVDVEHNFKPDYVIPQKAEERIAALKEEGGDAKNIILATDEDREGEAIAWHLGQVLGLTKPKRIVFHEITKSAIEKALSSPRDIDMRLVDAQQARRVLDRLVGYKLSPFLWKKVVRGLSAGRVQSVAVRLVVEREREIEKFIPEEYWSVQAELSKPSEYLSTSKKGEIETYDKHKSFFAKLHSKNGKVLDKLAIKSKEEAGQVEKALEGAEYKIESVERKETKKNPLPPFTTSTLQQEAWKKLRYPAKRTMMLAQNLYERGFITYHRTDSLNLSDAALAETKTFVQKTYGENYWPGFSRTFKTRARGAQEAHEAIRPTKPERTPESAQKLEGPQKKLYDLIWRRFIASQMSSAVFDSTRVDIATNTPYAFRANGTTMKFDGFLKVYPTKFEENELPRLGVDDILEFIELHTDQHFTQPPTRYTEASLVKALEEYGIGRPSTYAPILSTIQDRNYVQKNGKKQFVPTEIGTIVTDLLVEHFPKIVDAQFTAHIEEDLDKIAQGKENWTGVIREFYEPFAERLEKKYEEVEKKTQPEKTEHMCPECGSPLVIRMGRFGKFYACSNFPNCRHTEPLKSSKLGVRCPKCVEGELVEKRTRKGKVFYGCGRYPECDFALWDKPVTEDGAVRKCPECESVLVERKNGVACSNRECGFKQKGGSDIM